MLCRSAIVRHSVRYGSVLVRDVNFHCRDSDSLTVIMTHKLSQTIKYVFYVLRVTVL